MVHLIQCHFQGYLQMDILCREQQKANQHQTQPQELYSQQSVIITQTLANIFRLALHLQTAADWQKVTYQMRTLFLQH